MEGTPEAGQSLCDREVAFRYCRFTLRLVEDSVPDEVLLSPGVPLFADDGFDAVSTFESACFVEGERWSYRVEAGYIVEASPCTVVQFWVTESRFGWLEVLPEIGKTAEALSSRTVGPRSIKMDCSSYGGRVRVLDRLDRRSGDGEDDEYYKSTGASGLVIVGKEWIEELLQEECFVACDEGSAGDAGRAKV